MPAMPLAYRPATADDVPRCIELRALTRHNAVSAERLASYGITADSWGDALRRGEQAGIVCTQQGEIVGYCFGDTRSGEVLVLALQPAHEGQGVGRRLLDQVVEQLFALGHHRLFLGCSTDPATRSHGFYRHLGWVPTGQLDAHGDEVLQYPALAPQPLGSPLPTPARVHVFPAMSHSPAQAPITDANPSVEAMEARVARFRSLAATDDYVDAAIPGCERKTYRVLGAPGSAPLAADGFHMNIVCCKPGKSAPLHNHLTLEVFVALSGHWQVFWGPQGERSVRLERWDTISIPPGLSRGFRNVGDEPAYLLGLASGTDPGMINWPEPVRAAAAAVGLTLP